MGPSESKLNAYDRARALRRIGRPLEVAQVGWFGRSALSIAFRTPVLVLHTSGRRTGRPRTTPLAFHRSADGSLIVAGGAGGQTRTPDWVANLRSSSNAEVTVDRARLRVRSEELRGPARTEVWEQLRECWPRIDTYQRRAGRDVPVFRFTPA